MRPEKFKSKTQDFSMVDTYAERSELGWTAKRLSETLKIQAEGAGFLAKSNLCSSEAELEGVNNNAKLTFHRRKRNRLNPARKTVGAQAGGSH